VIHTLLLEIHDKDTTNLSMSNARLQNQGTLALISPTIDEVTFNNTFNVLPSNPKNDCLFNAIELVTGEKSHKLRSQLFNYYNDPVNKKFADLNNDSSDLNHNIDVKNKAHGNATDIIVLCKLRNIDIRLLKYDETTKKYNCISFNENNDVTEIHFIRMQNNHFDALSIKK
jgi:hypothetical protein